MLKKVISYNYARQYMCDSTLSLIQTIVTVIASAAMLLTNEEIFSM